MAVTIHAVFDGQVLRPQEPVSLEPNKQYVLTVEEDARTPRCEEESEYPLSKLLHGATDLGVTDLAERHDHYTRRR